MNQTQRASQFNASPPIPRGVLHVLADAPRDLAESSLTPHARLVWLSIVTTIDPWDFTADLAPIRRSTGLDPLSFRHAVDELRAAGHLATRADCRRRTAAGTLELVK